MPNCMPGFHKISAARLEGGVSPHTARNTILAPTHYILLLFFVPSLTGEAYGAIKKMTSVIAL